MYTYYSEALVSMLFYNFLGVLVIYFMYTAIKKVINKNKSSVETETVAETLENEVVEESKEPNAEESEEDVTDQHDSDKKEEKSKKRRSRFKANFRCLPCFILIYYTTLFFLMFYHY
jgi:phosphate/sulfate permease